jgi:hypothetical protein
MITMSNFGKHGRLGNQLFQIASMQGMAGKYQDHLIIPHWSYADFFNGPFDQRFDVMTTEQKSRLRKVNEPSFEYNSNFLDQYGYSEYYDNVTEEVDLNGYFQTEKYWLDCDFYVKHILTFKPEFVKEQRQKFKEVFQSSRPTIAIHLRRGDYVNHNAHYNLPINYYILALEEHFHNWRRKYNLMVFSDDPSYARLHFECVPNATIVFGNSDIEDLCLMSQCDHFIIANSSFSWWGAYLGEKEGTKVIRPVNHFTPQYGRTHNAKDYYPARWVAFNDMTTNGTTRKIDLSDCTFTIPVKFEHKDRRENYELIQTYLIKHFITRIVIQECLNPRFRRTKMLNDMAKAANTPYIANYDTDVLIAPMQILQAMELLRTDMASMVSPYDGRFMRTDRTHWYKLAFNRLDIGDFANGRHMRQSSANSWGGALFVNRIDYMMAGMENENYISFGNEDEERIHRFKTLGYKVERIPGRIYHMEHYRGINSTNKHADHHLNRAEWDKVSKMDKKQLSEYVSTWPWLKDAYI